MKILDLSEECRQLLSTVVGDFASKKPSPELLVVGLAQVSTQLERREQEYLPLEQELGDYAEVEGYLFVLGDQIKRVGLAHPRRTSARDRCRP